MKVIDMINKKNELEKFKKEIEIQEKEIGKHLKEYFNKEFGLKQDEWIESYVSFRDKYIYIEIVECEDGSDYGTAYRTKKLELEIYSDDKVLVEYAFRIEIKKLNEYINKIIAYLKYKEEEKEK